jgi:lipid-binding SYLF domain-containing protein
MKKTWLLLMCLCAILAGWPAYAAESNEAERLRDAARILDETMNVPEKAIPAAILEKAEAIAVCPSVIKGGLGIGAQHGRCVLSARNREGGTWSQPAFLSLNGGSFGAQIGAQAVDLILVVMNRRGLENLLDNEFKVGADASVAAGPVGRGAEAATDIQFRAEILSYSRARGLFAGVTVNGSVIKEDEDANRRFYGRPVSNRDLIDQGPRPVGTAGSEVTDAVNGWHRTLEKYAK